MKKKKHTSLIWIVRVARLLQVRNPANGREATKQHEEKEDTNTRSKAGRHWEKKRAATTWEAETETRKTPSKANAETNLPCAQGAVGSMASGLPTWLPCRHCLRKHAEVLHAVSAPCITGSTALCTVVHRAVCRATLRRWMRRVRAEAAVQYRGWSSSADSP